jgi:FecR protein
MVRLKSSIAISAWALALAIAAGVCQAQSIGTVTDLQGILLSRNGAGTIKILARDSSIESGDRLLTRPGTYARLTFVDQTAVTLGPESELMIVQFAYSDTGPSNSAVFDFVQGRVQIAAGRLGVRSVDRFILNTSIGTIAVGRATFIAGYTAPSGISRLQDPSANVGHFENVVYHPPTDGAPRPWLLLAQNTVAPNAAGLNPGLYVQVLDGAINLTNGGGTQNFTAGQFGFTPSFQQPPVILPANPGLQFTPPPSFTSTTGAAGGTSAAKPGNVDCQVR